MFQNETSDLCMESDEIKELIYEIRGKQVMIDSDLARLYGCANGTKTLNLAVKRNIDRFPERFCFQLTQEEYDNLRFQVETSKTKEIPLRFQIETLNKSGNKRGSNIKYFPYVFTEQGVAMISSILRTSVATEISIKIMDAFVEMRKFMMNNAVIFERVNQHELKLIEHDNKFDKVFNELQKEENIKQKVFFNGQVYDAYKALIDIIKQAKNNLVIIDNYIDDSILATLLNKNPDVEVIIITNENTSKLSESDIIKFNEQYPLVKVKHSSDFHDRFIIIDRSIIYHCGASLKDLGKKTFGINEMHDKSLLEKI